MSDVRKVHYFFVFMIKISENFINDKFSKNHQFWRRIVFLLIINAELHIQGRQYANRANLEFIMSYNFMSGVKWEVSMVFRELVVNEILRNFYHEDNK